MNGIEACLIFYARSLVKEALSSGAGYSAIELIPDESLDARSGTFAFVGGYLLWNSYSLINREVYISFNILPDSGISRTTLRG